MKDREGKRIGVGERTCKEREIVRRVALNCARPVRKRDSGAAQVA